MADKVKTAIFGKDLRIKLEDHELNTSGNKITIVPEGAGYFMPEIGPTSFLDWPSHKKFLLFGPRTYKRIFFIERKGAKCIDFGIGGIIYGPDIEQLKKANMALLAEKIGQDAHKGTPWYIWVILGLNFLIFLNIIGVIV